MKPKLFKLFGRITAERDQVIQIIKDFFQEQDCLCCYEKADDGCAHDHCHFIASREHSSMKNLRQAFSELCYKVIGEKFRYTIKEYDNEQDAEAYICKGHKVQASVKPEILINTMNIDVDECYTRFHSVAQDIKTGKKCVWKEIIEYIEKVNPDLFTTKFTRRTQVRIASHMYDYYLEKQRMIQGKYVQQCIIQTIIANKFKEKHIKKSMISTWCDDISYFNGMEMQNYQEVDDAFEDL